MKIFTSVVPFFLLSRAAGLTLEKYLDEAKVDEGLTLASFGNKDCPNVAPNGCEERVVFFLLDEVRDRIVRTNTTTYIGNIPFYSLGTLEQLGVYTEVYEAVLGIDDVRGTGVFNFGTANPFYRSQIFTELTGLGEFNGISGGGGDYGCVLGYQEFPGNDGKYVFVRFSLCGIRCLAP